ncbi:hypothetical protein [Owenweeksia hongkongensis]|uniref:hypothetical protein n=1 Tax=Owenweeksia hongkongensis TaxID=253245 RepID=UPI003A90A220
MSSPAFQALRFDRLSTSSPKGDTLAISSAPCIELAEVEVAKNEPEVDFPSEIKSRDISDETTKQLIV